MNEQTHIAHPGTLPTFALAVTVPRGLEPGQGTPGIALAVAELGTWALLLRGLGLLMGQRRAGRLLATAASGPALPE